MAHEPGADSDDCADVPPDSVIGGVAEPSDRTRRSFVRAGGDGLLTRCRRRALAIFGGDGAFAPLALLACRCSTAADFLLGRRARFAWGALRFGAGLADAVDFFGAVRFGDDFFRGAAFRLARFHARCSAAARLRNRFASRLASLNSLRARFRRVFAPRSFFLAASASASAAATEFSETVFLTSARAEAFFRGAFMDFLCGGEGPGECHTNLRRMSPRGKLSTKIVDKPVYDRHASVTKQLAGADSCTSINF